MATYLEPDTYIISMGLFHMVPRRSDVCVTLDDTMGGESHTGGRQF